MKKIKLFSSLVKLLSFLLLCFSFSPSALAIIKIGAVTASTGSGNNQFCTGSIEIIATGTAGPFNITIQNPTSQERNGIDGSYTFNELCSGDYEIIVTNAYGCTTTLNTSIDLCPHIIIADNPIIEMPLACNSNDGKILFLGAGHSGGTSPYTYSWSNGSSSNRNDNLIAGTYTLTLSDANGCIAEETYVLESPNAPELITFNDLPSCEGLSTGYADVVATNGAGHTISYSWSNGSTESFIENVVPGMYNVTVTFEDNDCQASASVEVVEKPSNGPLQAWKSGGHQPCAGWNGSIELSVSGGNVPYSVNWETGHSGLTLSNVGAGYYAATITDGCGRQISNSFSLDAYPSIDLEVNSISGCEGQGVVDIEVSGGSPPFAYNWMNKDSNTEYLSKKTQDLNNLESGSYCLTVTDQNNCRKSICVDVGLSGGVDIVKNLACPGLAPSVDIRIHNPNNTFIPQFTLKKGPNTTDYPINSSGNPISFTIPEIEPHTNYWVEVDIDGCATSTWFTFDHGEVLYPELEFVSWEGDTCTYNQICDGVDLGEVNRPIQILSGESGAFKCTVPILCNGVEQEERKIKKRIIRVIEYRALLRAAEFSGVYSSDYIDRLRTLLGNEKINVGPCDKIQICPTSLEFSSMDFPKNLLIPDDRPNNINEGNGCYFADCAFPVSDIEGCPSDLIDDLEMTWLNINWGKFNSCNPYTFNLYKLAQYESDLITEFQSDYLGSELNILIEEHGSEFYAVCINVTFCASDFSVLRDGLSTAISNCGEPIPIDSPYHPTQLDTSIYEHICDYTEAKEDLFYVLCDPYQVPLILDLRSGPPQIDRAFTGTSTASMTTQYFNDFEQNEALKNFSETHFDGKVLPRGLIASSSGSSLYDFSAKASLVNKIETPKITHHIDDWNLEQLIYCEEIEPELNYQIIYEQDNSTWIRAINSNEQIHINHLSKTAESIFIGGSFKKELNFDGQSLANIDNAAGFLLRISLDGSIQQIEIIENIDPDQTVIFSENRNGEILITGKKSEEEGTLSDGQNPSNTYFLSRFTKQGQLISINNINGEASTELLDLTLSKEEGSFAIALVTSSNLILNQVNIFSTDSPQVALINFDTNGSFKWSKTYNLENLDMTKLDITSNEDQNVFIGLTFSNDLVLDGQSISSSGMNDIALLKYKFSGGLSWLRTYGNEEDENVSQLFYNSAVLFFGGEFSGPSQSRDIGQHQFINILPTDRRAYISYIFDESNNSSDSRKGKMENVLRNKTKKAIEVFPNPFNHSLNIKIIDTNIQKIEISNTLGQIVFSSNKPQEKILNIEMNHMISGILFVKAYDQSNQIITIKKVIKL